MSTQTRCSPFTELIYQRIVSNVDEIDMSIYNEPSYERESFMLSRLK